MQYNSNLKLNNYYVEKILLEAHHVNPSFTAATNTIEPSIQRVVETIDNDNFIVKLLFEVNDEMQPFHCDVHLIGSFNLSDWKTSRNHDLVYHNTVAILFPFLRSIVASLTTSANLPPLILPVISTRDLFED